MVDLADEEDVGGFPGEVIEGDTKFEFGVFEESVADKEDSMPD